MGPLIDCQLCEDPLDPLALRRALPNLADCGGHVSFEGLVRNINHGKSVLKLEYEAYAALAVKEMQRIAEAATERFPLRYVLCVHRTGLLNIGDPAVIIHVLSRHRREAFEGCRYVIDQIKVRVPIWKKEYYDDATSAWTQCHEHGVEPLSIDGF